VATATEVTIRRGAARRTAQLLRSLSLDSSPVPPAVIRRVRSVNDRDTIDLLVSLQPSVIVVNGTRIISRAVLESLPRSVFLGMHAGITPRYRGVHGAYWALVSGDWEHCGVTVHQVDPGIDTGPIVAQATIQPTRADSFVTYPLLQLGMGVGLLADAVAAALDGRLETRPSTGPSRLWTHPTAAEYVTHRFRRGVA